MDKKPLSESDICDKFIRPAMEAARWSGMDQIYREFPLRAGRVVVRGQKSYRDKTTVVRADYALFHKPNIPLAVVEAKDNSHAMGAGMAQAIHCAELLGVPFSFSSNGDGFVFRDATLATGILEQTISLALLHLEGLHAGSGARRCTKRQRDHRARGAGRQEGSQTGRQALRDLPRECMEGGGGPVRDTPIATMRLQQA